MTQRMEKSLAFALRAMISGPGLALPILLTLGLLAWGTGVMSALLAPPDLRQEPFVAEAWVVGADGAGPWWNHYAPGERCRIHASGHVLAVETYEGLPVSRYGRPDGVRVARQCPEGALVQFHAKDLDEAKRQLVLDAEAFAVRTEREAARRAMTQRVRERWNP